MPRELIWRGETMQILKQSEPGAGVGRQVNQADGLTGRSLPPAILRDLIGKG